MADTDTDRHRAIASTRGSTASRAFNNEFNGWPVEERLARHFREHTHALADGPLENIMSPPFQWAAGGMKTRLGERRQNDATSVSYLKQGPKRTLAASPQRPRVAATDAAGQTDRRTRRTAPMLNALRYPRG